MKRIYYLIAVMLFVIACNPKQEPDPIPEDTFEVGEIEALSAQAQTFTVNVKTTVDFEVVMPTDAPWLTYLATKAVEVRTNSVEFSVSLNEEDSMRQTSVTFKSKDGKYSKNLAVMQKAGGGIHIEIQDVDDVPVEGGTIEIAVTSNVPFSVTSEDDWLTPEAAAESVTVIVAPNPGVEPREGKLLFFREGTDKKIAICTIRQSEPHVILANAGYANLASALEAYVTLDGNTPVTMVLDGTTHTGHITVGPDNAPLTIEGNSSAILDGCIEIKGNAVTVSGLKIASSTTGTTPEFETSTRFNFPFGIMVHDAGFGVNIVDTEIDMTNLDADATGIFLIAEETGSLRDVIRNSTIDGGTGHRLMQIYSAKASLTGNTFKNPYTSYAIRVGDPGGDVLLANNIFEGTSACAVHFFSLTDSKITLGTGSRDNNRFSDQYADPYKANSDVTTAGNMFSPAVEYYEGVVTVKADPTAMPALTRVWGLYNGKKGTWDDAITDRTNWNRNAVVSGNYVYVPIAGSADGQYGVAVLSAADGSYIRTITQGFQPEGTFYTCGIAKLPATDGDVIYVSNMALGGSNQKLMIYRLADYDSEGIPTKAEVALDGYQVPGTERLGDKMTSFNTNEDGLLFFVSFTKDGVQRFSIEFKVSNGMISSDPVASPYLSTAAGNSTASIHMFMAQTTGDNATRQAFYGSNFDFRYLVAWWWGTAVPDGWYQLAIESGAGGNVVDSEGHNVYSDFTAVGNYDANANDPCHFTIGGEHYLAYVTVHLDAQSRSYGYLKFIHIPMSGITATYPVMAAMYKNKDNAASFQIYPIGDSDDYFASGHESTNKTGFCDVMQTGDETYILAGITSTGVSMFKVE